MSFFSALTLIFVVLKLVGVISWSWWLVFIPTLIEFLIFFGGIAFAWFMFKGQ